MLDFFFALSPGSNRRNSVFALLLGLAFVSGCGSEQEMIPRPRAYPKVDFPTATSHVEFNLEACPLRFSLPDYIEVERDTAYFDEAPKHPCWFDLVIPSINGRFYFSYYPINSQADFEELRDDAYTLVGKHNTVANYIEETRIDRPEAQVYGYAFAVEGDAASPYQFFVTDSTRHFLRAAIYVNAQADADSLAPIYAFMRRDMDEIVSSLRWD